MSGKVQGVRTGGFRDAYLSLPANKLKAFRALVCESCGWTEFTWGNKLNGRSSIRKLEAAVLEAEFAKFDIDPWTGARLTEKLSA